MWDNAHPAAKMCLVTAGGISATPIMEEIYLYNARNPQTVIDFIKGFEDLPPIGPGSKAYNTGNAVRKTTEWLLK